MYKVIFGLSERGITDRVLTNILNILEDFKEEDIKIELVVYADAINCFTMKSRLNMEKISKIISEGVVISACRNSLEGNSLSVEDFDFNLNIVPTGIGEIIRKQKDGWIYIKP